MKRRNFITKLLCLPALAWVKPLLAKSSYVKATRAAIAYVYTLRTGNIHILFDKPIRFESEQDTMEITLSLGVKDDKQRRSPKSRP